MENCCYSDFREKPPVRAGNKNSHIITIIIIFSGNAQLDTNSVNRKKRSTT